MKVKLQYLCIATFLFAVSACYGGSLVIDHRHTDITKLTAAKINQAKSVLHIAYGHTSHGSQLTDGMSGLVGFANGGGKGLALPDNAFAWNNGGTGGALDLHDYAMGGDVGYHPAWVNNTIAYLNNPANSDVNVVIWSWCGQMTSKFTSNKLVSEYLAPMSALESSYPNVIFVYMTGHVDIGQDANQKAACQAIRDYCIANNKVLYDFADIEHYDPDGNYYEFVDDNCGVYTSAGAGLYDNWATRWQGSHTVGVDWYNCSSAHSQALNANQKAYAAWALWCALAADLDRDGLPDEWEGDYGGKHLFHGGNHDFDIDGMTDWEEFVANTVPTNPASQFAILSLAATNNCCTIAFLSSAARIYELRSSDNLKNNLWPVVGNLTNQAGTGAMMSLTDTDTAPFRAYRLVVSLP